MSRIHDAWRWMRSQRDFRRGTYDRALRNALNIKGTPPNEAAFSAYIATLYVLNNDSRNASNHFRRALELSKEGLKYQGYIELYCTQYLYIIDNQHSNVSLQEELIDFVGKGCSPSYLPVPEFIDVHDE